MKILTRTLLVVCSSLLSFILLGCGSSTGTSTDVTENTNIVNDVVAVATYKEDAGRLLGSQCAQCHGTDGTSTNSWDSIAGESDLIDEIYDDEPIMSAQAHGYTSEEIVLIGDWLQTL